MTARSRPLRPAPAPRRPWLPQIRAGQWKLRWAGRHIDINQVADVGPTTRSARLVFDRDGSPCQLVQMVYRKFGPFMLGAYRPWKESKC